MPKKKTKSFAIIAITLLVSTLLCYFTLLLTSQLVDELVEQEQTTVKQVVSISDSSEPKAISRLLRISIEFEFLTIKDESGHVFYRYIKNDEDLSSLFKLLKSLSLLPSQQSVTINDLVIVYGSSFDRSLTPMSYVFLIVAILPFIITLSLLTHRRILNLNFNSLHKQLSKFLNGDTSANVPNKFIELLLAHQIIDEQQQPKINKTTKYDPLTGMRSGHQFIYDYDYHLAESIDRNASNQCAVLVLLRVQNIKQINYKLGFEHGDTCLSVVSDVIKKVCPNRQDKLYKINGTDFGIILYGSNVEQGSATVANIKQILSTVPNLTEFNIKLGSAALEFNQHTKLSTLLATADALADS